MQDGLESTGYAAGAARADGRGRAGLARALPWLVLVALLAWLCAWRVSCVGAGPDPDTDAYGHYVIARLLPDTPSNFRMHWVWLPLYHVVLSLPIALGATLDDVRTGNAIAAALPALILFAALRKPARSSRSLLDDGAPFLAASLTALSPLFMQLGTTGQMEVFFCVLLVLAVALLSRGRHGWAALVLSALVLTRYEGWAVACVVAAVFLSRCFTRRQGFFLAPSRGRLACVLLPALCVLGWAALRRLGGEPWFGFLFENQVFAERVLKRQPDSHGALGGLGRYTLSVPFRVFGLALPLALLGLVPTWRHGALREAGIDDDAHSAQPGHGIWFVLPGLGIVAFLTLSSLSRSQLGLDRHFVSVVPFVATWIAFGTARAADLFSGAVRGTRHSAAMPALFGALGVVIFGAAVVRLGSARAAWWTATAEALPEPRGVAAFLRETPPSSLIVCDNASVEVLSGLDRKRFVRAHIDAGTVARVDEWSRSRDVYIVSRARHLRAFFDAGRASYGTLDGDPEALAVVAHPSSPP